MTSLSELKNAIAKQKRIRFAVWPCQTIRRSESEVFWGPTPLDGSRRPSTAMRWTNNCMLKNGCQLCLAFHRFLNHVQIHLGGIQGSMMKFMESEPIAVSNRAVQQTSSRPCAAHFRFQFGRMVAAFSEFSAQDPSHTGDSKEHQPTPC